MTRIDSVRAATGSAKDSVLHAAEVVAPYADTAKDRAAHYAHEARVRLAPEGVAGRRTGPRPVRRPSRAASGTGPLACAAEGRPGRARGCRPYPQGGQVRPPTTPCRASGRRWPPPGPSREEAAARSAAALAALRGQVTPKEIQKLVRKHERRAQGRPARQGAGRSGSRWRAAPSPPGSGGTSRPTRTGWSNRPPRRRSRGGPADVGRRQRPVRARPRGAGQAGRGGGRDDRDEGQWHEVH